MTKDIRISIEAGWGVGKSTLVNYLEKHLDGIGLMHEPIGRVLAIAYTNSDKSKKIKTYLPNCPQCNTAIEAFVDTKCY